MSGNESASAGPTLLILCKLCVLKIIVLQLDLKIYLQIDNFLLNKINDEEKKPKQ